MVNSLIALVKFNKLLKVSCKYNMWQEEKEDMRLEIYFELYVILVFIKQVFKLINGLGINNMIWKFIPGIYYPICKEVSIFRFIY